MKYSYNNIMEPWYLEEFKIIDMEPIRKNYYAISNYGRVMNIKTHKLINTFQGSGGYYRVSLNNEDKTRTTYQVHILVALHFIPRTHDDIINNRNIVNHKNLLTFVNYVHNLEWVNISENAAHSHQYRHLKLTSAVSRIKNNPWADTKGSKNGMSKLTEDQVHKMCQLLEKDIHILIFAILQDLKILIIIGIYYRILLEENVGHIYLKIIIYQNLNNAQIFLCMQFLYANY